MKNNTWVRDTLIKVEDYKNLNNDTQHQIDELITEFNQLGYIDFRTEMGPNQIARMSEKQRSKLSNNASKAFQIEMQIKRLLIPDSQLKRLAIVKQKEKNKEVIHSYERYQKWVFGMSTSFTKSGKIRKSIQRGIDDHQHRAINALKSNSRLNVKLLLLEEQSK